MNNKRLSSKASCAGGLLAAALLAGLTGCVGYVDRPHRQAYVEPAVVVVDDYVYYPSYEIYYSSSRHQYAYLEGGAWVSQPAPRGVSVEVLFASPSVRMEFHDSPAHHHARVVRDYPRNWTPRGEKHDRKDDKHGENRQSHGK